MENDKVVADLTSVVVYSYYLTSAPPNHSRSFLFNKQKGDYLSTENDPKIGEMTLKNTDSSEKTLINSPFSGKILEINQENIENHGNLLYRIQICSHSPWESNLNCRFCVEKPYKLDPLLEKLYFFNFRKPHKTLKLLKIKPKIGKILSKNDEIMLLQNETCTFQVLSQIGGVFLWFANDFSSEKSAFALKPCRHPEVFQDICTICSEVVLEKTETHENAHILIKGVTIRCEEGKKKYAELEKQGFLERERLILVLDLDNTLLHAAKFSAKEVIKLDQEEMKDVFEWRSSLSDKFLIKLRPFLSEFFSLVQPLYEIFLYTMGTRGYAEYNRCLINQFKGGKIPSDKMIALEDNFLLAEKKIKRMLPYCDELFLILDDRTDVWPEDQKNLVITKPFFYFREGEKEKQNGQNLVIRKYDCFLFFAARTLKRVHTIFFILKKKGITADVRDILSFLRKNVFLGRKIGLSRLVERNSTDPKGNWYLSTCVNGGGLVVENLEKDGADILVVREFTTTHKVNVAIAKGIPIVHFNWLSYCVLFSSMIDWKSFVLTPEKPKEKEIWDMEKELVAENEQFLDGLDEEIIKKAIEFFSK